MRNLSKNRWTVARKKGEVISFLEGDREREKREREREREREK